MSSWLRSSQQELCRKNKSSLTASHSQRKPLFYVAVYNRSSCDLQSDQGFKCLIIPRQHFKGHQYFSDWKKNGDITFRHFRITFPYRCEKLQKKCKPNDIFTLIFIMAVRLHHKSPDICDWQHHDGPLENCPNSQIR